MAYNRVVTFDEAARLPEMPLFTTYFLPDGKDKIPTKVLQDSSGRIWVGSSDGLFRLEKSDDQFKHQLIQINSGGFRSIMLQADSDNFTNFVIPKLPSIFRLFELIGKATVQNRDRKSTANFL